MFTKEDSRLSLRAESTEATRNTRNGLPEVQT